MKLLYILSILLLLSAAAGAQQNNSMLLGPVDPIPMKHLVAHPPYGTGPTNNHVAHKETSGGTTYSDWYDLWDEMYDTTSLTLTHSYLYYWDVYTDSNLLDTTGFFPPYHVFTHGLGMSFDPSDSAYYYHAYNPAYRVSKPFPFTLSYKLDSFWVPGQYMRYDTTAANVDSLIVELLVSQTGGTPPDSGAYALMATAPAAMYLPCTADKQPRFVTPRYFRAADECIDPVLTTVVHQRYAFPLTITEAFYYRTIKFALTTPITVTPGHYVASYVWFKSHVAYPLVTSTNYANYYWLYAGEPTGLNNWFPQSAHNTAIGYPGSHQDGLIATNQIRYNDAGFTFNSHNVLLPSYSYANTGANLSPGFDVPQMAFHIKWTMPDTSLSTIGAQPEEVSVSAFPNPACDLLNIAYALREKSGAHLWLVDMFGQVCAEQQIADAMQGNAVFNLASHPAGIYTWVLEAGGARYNGRITVIR